MIIISNSSFAQEKKVELKIREKQNVSLSKISNENILERKNHRDEIRVLKNENLRPERHIRPHFEKSRDVHPEKKESLKREFRNENRQNRIERNNR